MSHTAIEYKNGVYVLSPAATAGTPAAMVDGNAMALSDRDDAIAAALASAQTALTALQSAVAAQPSAANVSALQAAVSALQTAVAGLQTTVGGKADSSALTAVSTALSALQAALPTTYLPLTGGTLSGNVSATAFYGDGSHLTNLPSSATPTPTLAAVVAAGATTPNALTIGPLTVHGTGGLATGNINLDNTSSVNIKAVDGTNVPVAQIWNANQFYIGSFIPLGGQAGAVTQIRYGRGNGIGSAVVLNGNNLTMDASGLAVEVGSLATNGYVVAATYYGDGSHLTNLPTPTPTPTPTLQQVTAAGATTASNVSVGTLTATSNVSATAFYGDGSHLTNLPASAVPTLQQVTAAGAATTSNVSVGSLAAAAATITGNVLIGNETQAATTLNMGWHNQGWHALSLSTSVGQGIIAADQGMTIMCNEGGPIVVAPYAGQTTAVFGHNSSTFIGEVFTSTLLATSLSLNNNGGTISSDNIGGLLLLTTNTAIQITDDGISNPIIAFPNGSSIAAEGSGGLKLTDSQGNVLIFNNGILTNNGTQIG